MGAPTEAGRLLERVAAHVGEPDDHLRFTIEADPEHPSIEGEGIVYLPVRLAPR